jgi:porin
MSRCTTFVASVLCVAVTVPCSAGEHAGQAHLATGGTAAREEGLILALESQAAPPQLRARTNLLGDIGGLRPWLQELGVSLEITSVDEGLASPDGDDSGSTARHYTGLTDLVLTLDTETAGWWRGGTLVVDLQSARGGDLSECVGDVQGVSNIVGPPRTRLAEYHLVQELADGKLRVKLGKQDANADFVVSEGGGEFVNSSFGLMPTVPLPTYPAPALGAMAAWSAHNRVTVAAGVWDGAPAVGSGCLETAFDGAGGTVSAVGLEVAAFGDSVLPGTYRVGVWRHSEVEVAVTGKAPGSGETGAAAGLYLTADQELWARGERRLAVFGQAGWGETDRSAVSRYLGGGLTMRAPFAQRPADVVGLAVAHAHIGDLERPDPSSTSEVVVELFYRLPLAGWMTISPDLQWVRRPGGDRDRSALVAGLRVATAF